MFLALILVFIVRLFYGAKISQFLNNKTDHSPYFLVDGKDTIMKHSHQIQGSIYLGEPVSDHKAEIIHLW